MSPSLPEARRIAAAALEAIGDTANAAIVRAGGGDDFPEIQIALAALAQTSQRIDLLERTLAHYADASFWEADIPEAALAWYDHGEIARAALQGKDLLAVRD